jgi:hypothetical protein
MQLLEQRSTGCVHHGLSLFLLLQSRVPCASSIVAAFLGINGTGLYAEHAVCSLALGHGAGEHG